MCIRDRKKVYQIIYQIINTMPDYRNPKIRELCRQDSKLREECGRREGIEIYFRRHCETWLYDLLKQGQKPERYQVFERLADFVEHLANHCEDRHKSLLSEIKKRLRAEAREMQQNITKSFDIDDIYYDLYQSHRRLTDLIRQNIATSQGETQTILADIVKHLSTKTQALIDGCAQHSIGLATTYQLLYRHYQRLADELKELITRTTDHGETLQHIENRLRAEAKAMLERHLAEIIKARRTSQSYSSDDYKPGDFYSQVG